MLSYVYVLSLEQNKWYVGLTDTDISERIEDHMTNHSAQWVKKYKPIKMVEYFKGTKRDENILTLKYMIKYKWWNVRGGSWTAARMTQAPHILDKIDEIDNFEFNSDDSVDSNVESESDSEIDDSCFRCGRYGHLARDCIAKTDVDGNYFAQD